jgi:Sec-independent protein translocase protein TatA
MKRIYSLTVSILIVSILFIGTKNLSFAGRNAARSYPVSTHEIAGEQEDKKFSLEDSSSKQLSQNEREQIEKEKKLFIERTSAIRKLIFEKKLAMRNELIKNPPNGRNLGKLRREIVILKSQLNRQRYAFLKKMSTINPQVEGYYERGIKGNNVVKN